MKIYTSPFWRVSNDNTPVHKALGETRSATILYTESKKQKVAV